MEPNGHTKGIHWKRVMCVFLSVEMTSTQSFIQLSLASPEVQAHDSPYMPHDKRQGQQLVCRSVGFFSGRGTALVNSRYNNLLSTELCSYHVTRVLLGGGSRKLPFPFQLERNAASWKAGGLLQISIRSIHSPNTHSWVCGSFRWEKGEIDQKGIPWLHKEVLCNIHQAKSDHDGEAIQNNPVHSTQLRITVLQQHSMTSLSPGSHHVGMMKIIKRETPDRTTGKLEEKE